MKPPHPISSSTSIKLASTLHLNAFRGVRAISQFDWPFTPTLRSSEVFSTTTSSVLHAVLPALQPAQGQITRFRVYYYQLNAQSALSPKGEARPIQTRFRCGFVSEILILAGNSNSQAHYAKGTLSQPQLLQPLVGVWFQGLFHSVIHGSFHLSLTVLVHYRSLRSIQPYRMVPVDSVKVPRAPTYSGYP